MNPSVGGAGFKRQLTVYFKIDRFVLPPSGFIQPTIHSLSRGLHSQSYHTKKLWVTFRPKKWVISHYLNYKLTSNYNYYGKSGENFEIPLKCERGSPSQALVTGRGTVRSSCSGERFAMAIVVFTERRDARLRYALGHVDHVSVIIGNQDMTTSRAGTKVDSTQHLHKPLDLFGWPNQG